MQYRWSDWKRFPDGKKTGTVEVSSGAGVYEVRHAITGRVVAFGSAGNVARRLSKLTANVGLGGRVLRLLRVHPLPSRVSDLEYRTLIVASRAEAKTAAHHLSGLRHSARRLRMHRGWAARPSN